MITPKTRKLRCEPLEDRRMLSVTLRVDDSSTAAVPDGLAWDTAYVDLQSALTEAAIRNADANLANDVSAIWIAEGTYHPTAELEPGDPRSASFSLVNNVSLYGGFAGTETTFADRDLTAAHTTTLSGDLGVLADASDNAYTVVDCGENITATLDGLSIVDGNAGKQGLGGGVYNKGILLLTNSKILNNSASLGGGICSTGTVHGGTVQLTINNSTISGNHSDSSGGGIYSSGLQLPGIGIYSSAQLTIINSIILDNDSSGFGGGIACGLAQVTIIDSIISGNRSNRSGGGIQYGDYTGTTQMTVTNSTVTDNRTSGDGGMGGGIYNAGILTLTNSTITNNSAAHSGSGIASGPDNNSITTLSNSIVAGNTENDIDLYSGTLTGYYNLIGSGSWPNVLVDGVDGNQVGTYAEPLDPGFVDPENGNYRLAAGSPAIDAGDNSLVPSGVITDLAGNYRIAGGTVDIGAYEFGAGPVVFGDANGDGRVDGSDVTILAGNWQAGVSDGSPRATWSMGDFNGDGKVDGSDVTILAGNWQAGVSATVVAVSEPEPEAEPTRQFVPPVNAEFGVATVPQRESLSPRRFITPSPEAADAVLAKLLWSETDITAIAKDLAIVSAKKTNVSGGVCPRVFWNR